MTLLSRLASLFRKQRLDDELNSELAAHVEFATDEFVKQGLAPEEARRRALISLGGVAQSKEIHRDARGLPAVDTILQDLMYALRTLQRDRGFALFTTLIIALGVGATATVFSVVNGALFKGLPFEEPDRIVAVFGTKLG